MGDFLVFTLAAPLASFGVAAGNFSRGSDTSPGHSLIAGLLGAALGLDREAPRLLALSDALRVAVAMDARGAPLRDFHTVQSRRERKGPGPLTRRQALADDGSYTTISERDYFCDVQATIAVAVSDGPFSLADLKAALREPRFTLYFGRKSCPLALPPAPEILAAETADVAMRAYREARQTHDALFPARRGVSRVQADARLYGDRPDARGRRTRRRVAPGARSVWSYRLLDELTLGGGEGAT